MDPVVAADVVAIALFVAALTITPLVFLFAFDRRRNVAVAAWRHRIMYSRSAAAARYDTWRSGLGPRSNARRN